MGDALDKLIRLTAGTHLELSRKVETPEGERFYHKPIGTVLSGADILGAPVGTNITMLHHTGSVHPMTKIRPTKWASPSLSSPTGVAEYTNSRTKAMAESPSYTAVHGHFASKADEKSPSPMRVDHIALLAKYSTPPAGVMSPDQGVAYASQRKQDITSLDDKSLREFLKGAKSKGSFGNASILKIIAEDTLLARRSSAKAAKARAAAEEAGA